MNAVEFGYPNFVIKRPQVLTDPEIAGSENLVNKCTRAPTKNGINCPNFLSLKSYVAHRSKAFISNMDFIILPTSFLLARPSIALVGSDPIESKPINGVRILLSSHVASKFNITPSAYFSPADSAIYALAWDNVRSGHHDL